MDMPRPGPKHDVLARMAGRWIGEETMMPSPWSPVEKKCEGVVEARMLEGFFLVSEYEQRIDGETSFRGHGVYGYDPEKDEYRMHWFDSMGGPGGVAHGRFADQKLTFQNTSPFGHHRYQYTFAGSQYVFEMSMSQDGQHWNTMMVGKYRPA